MNASLIVNCLPQPADDATLEELSSRSRPLDEPIEDANLCEFLDPARTGNDGAMLLELVHRTTKTFAPRIRSCQIKLPTDVNSLHTLFARPASGHDGACIISLFTDALMIVVSETDRSVRLVQGGRMEILPAINPSSTGLRLRPMLKVQRRDSVLQRFLTSSSASVKGTRGSGHDLIMSRLLETSQDLVNRLIFHKSVFKTAFRTSASFSSSMNTPEAAGR
jgi:hypothetical protein